MLWIAGGIGFLTVAGMVGVWPSRAAWAPLLRWPRSAHQFEVIFFVDGPLAGTTNQLPMGWDGLPPQQFCAVVPRPGALGGTYTLPYQRGSISEIRRAWQYTQGWDLARIS